MAFLIDQSNYELDKFGSAAYRIDACSVEALAGLQAELSRAGVNASIDVNVGLMGPSANACYSTPTLSLMGLTFGLKVEVGTGVGIKGTAGVDAEVNYTKKKKQILFH